MDVGLVPMRPRGHPSRLYSDLALIQQYRSGVSGGTVGGLGSSGAGADAAVTSSSVELSSGSVSPHTGSECDDRASSALQSLGAEQRRSAASGPVMDGSSDELMSTDQPQVSCWLFIYFGTAIN